MLKLLQHRRLKMLQKCFPCKFACLIIDHAIVPFFPQHFAKINLLLCSLPVKCTLALRHLFFYVLLFCKVGFGSWDAAPSVQAVSTIADAYVSVPAWRPDVLANTRSQNINQAWKKEALGCRRTLAIWAWTPLFFSAATAFCADTGLSKSTKP